MLSKLLERILPHDIAWKIVEADRDNQYMRRCDQELGWKHARVQNLPVGMKSYPSGTGFVAVVKNPSSWLLSLYTRPYQNENLKPLSFQEFIRHPWTTVGRECSNTAAYPTSVHLWNDKVSFYTALGTLAPAVVARYEVILRSPIVFLQGVALEYSMLTAAGGTRTAGFEMPEPASSRLAAVPSQSGGAGLEHRIAS